jgi:hypothetical protein
MFLETLAILHHVVHLHNVEILMVRHLAHVFLIIWDHLQIVDLSVVSMLNVQVIELA